MAFDEELASRVRDCLGVRSDVTEKRMFGGLAFLLGGHMCCGIVGDDLMVRVGPDAFEDALSKPHARPMDFTGTPSKGMVYVAPPGLRTAKSLASWVHRGVAFAASLPPKAAPRKARTRSARTPKTKR